MTWVALEWGPQAIPNHDHQPLPAMVVVDVLSFTTTLSIAMDLGMEVLPHPFEPNAAAELAREAGATLAVGRREARDTGGVSLSPAGLRRAVGVRRLVLPSPNGAAISHQLSTTPWSTDGHPAIVLGACLRNASAVGEWLTARETEDVLLIPVPPRLTQDVIRSGRPDSRFV